jgi:Fe-S-cluster containining protein
MAMIDKDKPWTWVKYKNGMCEGCHGTCCTMPVEVKGSDLVRLGVCSIDELETSVKKLAKRLQKEKIITSFRQNEGAGSEVFMLSARPNGDCHFLDFRTRLCTVYDKRPEVCRKFPDIGPKPGFCPCTKKGL